MNNPMIRRVTSALIAALLLIYIGYQMYNAGYQSVQTETAVYASLKDVIQADAFAVRKETLIPASISGVISYREGKGGKVAKGGVVADVYSTEQDAAAYRQIEELDKEIEQLTSLNNPGDTYAANPDLLDEQINQKFTELLQLIQDEEFSSLAEASDSFLYLVNQRQVVTGEITDFNSRISALKNQRAALSEAKAIGQITSPVSGYFTSQTDGYESFFDYENILSITPDDIRNAQGAEVSPATGMIGKVSEQFNWYLVCIVPADVALKLSTVHNSGRRVYVSMPFASSSSIPMTVEAVNQKDKESEAAIVLECSYMDDNLAAIREETVQIQIAEYEGIRVSQKAIHFEDITEVVTDEDGNKTEVVYEDVRGVYVMHGSEIEFVQIFPVFSSESYVICETVDQTSDRWDELVTDRSIQLSDEVVVEGTDLYDGKVVK